MVEYSNLQQILLFKVMNFCITRQRSLWKWSENAGSPVADATVESPQEVALLLK